MMTAGSIYRNLDNWNFGTLGKYQIDQQQAESLLKTLERDLPRPKRKKSGDISKGIPDLYTCPTCNQGIKKEWNYCPYCGQYTIRAREDKE